MGFDSGPHISHNSGWHLATAPLSLMSFYLFLWWPYIHISESFSIPFQKCSQRMWECGYMMDRRGTYPTILKAFLTLLLLYTFCMFLYAMTFLVSHRMIRAKRISNESVNAMLSTRTQVSPTFKYATTSSCNHSKLSKSTNKSFIEAVNMTRVNSSSELGGSHHVNLPSISVSAANCTALFRGDTEEIEKALCYQKGNPKQVIFPKQYLNLSKDCDFFKAVRGYILDPMTASEASFPIAYSIVVFKGIEQVERLLRAIYRPQNSYCIHVDSKSGDPFKKALAAIVGCFDNVFLASRSVDVRWGQFSVLEADLICMKDLWEASATWKYFINLTGQEFPLKTNAELVKILNVYNGANNLEGTIRR